MKDKLLWGTGFVIAAAMTGSVLLFAGVAVYRLAQHWL